MDMRVIEVRLDVFNTILETRDTIAPDQAADLAISIAQKIMEDSGNAKAADCYNKPTAETARALS